LVHQTKICSLSTFGQPVVQYCTYFGGANIDPGYALAFDSQGNRFLAGQSNSPSGIATPGAFQEQKAGGSDGVISKWGVNDELIWST